MESASILIPSHNGGERLLAVLRGLRPLNLPVLVADDGSTDGSGAAARDEGAAVIRLPSRSGKGAALRRGFKALAEAPPEWVIFMDADGQHRPEEVPAFLEAMRPDVDLLLGSRMEEAASRMPGYRRTTNRMGSRILYWMSGAAVPDTQCGFRAVRWSVLSRLELESDGFEIETEILLKALRLGARWRSVPVSAVYDGEKSNFLPVADTFRICMAALRYVRG